MKLNPKAPDTIEVDFERTIQMVNPNAKIYALEEEATKVAGGAQPMPLTLRANVGDCLKVKLTNRMKESRASFSAIGLAFDPKDSLGRERRQQSRRSDHCTGREPHLHLFRGSVPRRDRIVGVGLGQCDDQSSKRPLRSRGDRSEGCPIS